jgi:hypothetical protein
MGNIIVDSAVGRITGGGPAGTGSFNDVMAHSCLCNSHDRVIGIVDFQMITKGKVVQESLGNFNSLTTEGKNAIRDYVANATVFAAALGPYVGLFLSSATITAATTLVGLTTAAEPATANAYARVRPTWTPTAGQIGPNAAAFATVTGVNWAALDKAFLTYQASGFGSGIVFSWVASITGGPFTVNIGSSLTINYQWSIA